MLCEIASSQIHDLRDKNQKRYQKGLIKSVSSTLLYGTWLQSAVEGNLRNYLLEI